LDLNSTTPAYSTVFWSIPDRLLAIDNLILSFRNMTRQAIVLNLGN